MLNVHKPALNKASHDLMLSDLERSHTHSRALVAERQRINLEKGRPMEAYDALAKEGALGPAKWAILEEEQEGTKETTTTTGDRAGVAGAGEARA